MAAATKTKLKNFIGGKAVDPTDGGSEDVVNPATGEVIARGAPFHETRRRRRRRGGEAGLRRLGGDAAGGTCPRPAPHRRPDRGEGRGDRRPRGRRCRQAALGGAGGRGAGDGRQPSLLRRRGALPGGPRGWRVHGGPHVLHPPRADRGRRPDHPLELPADDGDLEDRSRARRRQHDRAEAGRDDASDDAAVRRVVRRHPAARRVQRDRRPRRPDRRRAGDTPGRRDGLAHRLAADREVDREGRRRQPQAGPPGAGRQGPRDRLRRRRDGDCAGDDRRHRLLQRRPGLHRRHQGARRQRRLRRRRQRSRLRSEWPRPRRHALLRHHPGAAQLPAPARAGRGLPGAQAGQGGGRHRREAARPARATSSSRPSSRASSRATR